MQQTPALLPLRIIARRLRVPFKWLRDEALAGRVPCLNAGGKFLAKEQAVEAALLARTCDNRPESEAGHEPLDTPATSPDLAAIAADVKALREIVAAKLSAPAPAAFSDTDSPQHPRP